MIIKCKHFTNRGSMKYAMLALRNTTVPTLVGVTNIVSFLRRNTFLFKEKKHSLR